MSNLFYGGKDGRSFVIGATFESVGAMLTALAKTTDYIDVNYGDYILIAPKNLDHPDNGMLFKRGTDFQSKLDMAYYAMDDEGNYCWQIEDDKTELIGNGTRPAGNISSYGAVYVGQIAGPGGNAPNVQILSSAEQFLKDGDQKLIGLDINGDGALDPDSEDDIIIKNNLKIVASAAESKEFSIGNKGLVPGKTNSVISYEYCTLRTVDGKCSDVYIGFQVPYPEFEVGKVDTVDPTTKSSFTLNKMTTPAEDGTISIWEKGSDNLNPFFYTVDVELQRGHHGDSVSNVEINDEGYLEVTYTNADGLPSDITSNEFYTVEEETYKEGKCILRTLKNKTPQLNYVTGVSLNEDSSGTKIINIHYAYPYPGEGGTDTITMAIEGDLKPIDLSKHTYFGTDETIASNLPNTGLWFVTKGEE